MSVCVCVLAMLFEISTVVDLHFDRLNAVNRKRIINIFGITVFMHDIYLL